jgi:uncharacterized membrane protein
MKVGAGVLTVSVMLFTKEAHSLPHAEHYRSWPQVWYVEKQGNSIAFLVIMDVSE